MKYSWPRLLWSTPILSIVLPKFSTLSSSKFFIFIYRDFFIQTEVTSVVTMYAKFRDLKEWKIQRYAIIFETARSRFFSKTTIFQEKSPKTALHGLKNDLIFLNFPFFEVTKLCIHCHNTISFGLNKIFLVNEDEKF